MRGQFELVMIAVIFMLTTMGVMNTMVGRSSMMNQALSKDIRLEDAIELQEDRIYLESAAFTALMEKNVCGFNLDLFDMEQDIEAFNATPSGNHTDAIVGSPENCFDLRQDGDAEWDTACSVSGVGEGFIYFNYTWNETWHAYLDDLDTYPIELRGKYGRSSGGYINMSCWNYTGGEWKTLVEYDGGSGDPIFFATLERDCIPSFDEKAQFRVFLQGALAQEVKMYAQVLVFWRENPYWHAMDYAVGKVNEAAEDIASTSRSESDIERMMVAINDEEALRATQEGLASIAERFNLQDQLAPE